MPDNMTFYTVDALPLGSASALLQEESGGTRSGSSRDDSADDLSGSSLIVLYRLFLDLHHAGGEPYTLDNALRSNGGAAAPTDDGWPSPHTNAPLGRVAPAASHGAQRPMASVTSSGQFPLADGWQLERLAAAATATGNFPLFALPARSLPPVGQLKGFPEDVEPRPPHTIPVATATACGTTATPSGTRTKVDTQPLTARFSAPPPVSTMMMARNTNRSANNMEELPVRVGLLSSHSSTWASQQQQQPTNGNGTAAGGDAWHPAVLQVELAERSRYCIPQMCPPPGGNGSDGTVLMFCCGTITP